MATVSDTAVPALRDVLATAEKRLAGLRKDADERRKWLANNVPDLNSKLTTPATRALFATKLRAADEAQPLEATPISAEQLVQILREQLQMLQDSLVQKNYEIEETKMEHQKAEEDLALLVRLRKLREAEGEIRQDERLGEKLLAANRQFKSQRKWLVTMIEDVFADSKEMSNLLKDLTTAYYSDGVPYITAVTDRDRMLSCLATLLASGVVTRHPYEPDQVRMQDLS